VEDFVALRMKNPTVTGPEVLDEHVGAFEQALQHIGAFRALQVDRHAGEWQQC
jgi:hypothetical protein